MNNDIFAKLKSVTIKIEIKNKLHGTGFIISNSGHILTCAHVININGVNLNKFIPYKNICGNGLELQIVDVDKENDLAILFSTLLITNEIFSLRHNYQIVTNDCFYSYGFGYTQHEIQGEILTTDDIQNINTTYNKQRYKFSIKHTGRKLMPGDSGSPLYCEESNSIIGIIDHRYIFSQEFDKNNVQNFYTGFAIPFKNAIPFFEKNGITFAILKKSAEIPGFTAISAEFISRERKRHLENANIYNQQNFYSALPHVQWWGVFNNLIAPKQIYSEIKHHVFNAIKTSFKPIVAFITGSGGTGKSTILRNLAFDLYYTVGSTIIYWLDDWFEFEESNQMYVFFETMQTQIILIDNWNGFDADEKKGIIRFVKKSETCNNVKIIITGRETEEKLKKQMLGNSCFNLDEIKSSLKGTDNEHILSKIAEITDNEKWKKNAENLKQQNIINAKTFQLLFILSRLSEQNTEINLSDNYREIFNEIIKNDIDKLRNSEYTKGFAYALIDYASIFSHSFDYKANITKDTFLRLADFYHDNKAHNLYKNFIDLPFEKEQWNVLHYYISIFQNKNDKQGVTGIQLTFNKDDFAEAIVEIFKEEFLSRQKQVIEFIINDDSHFSASRVFYVAARYGNLFSANEIFKFFELLLKKCNPHHSFASFLLGKNYGLNIEFKERWHLIKIYLSQNPPNYWFIALLIFWLKSNIKNASFLLKIIEELIYNDNIKNNQTIGFYLKQLSENEKKAKAVELIKDKATNIDAFGILLNAIGKTKFTEQKAEELLSNSSTSPETINACFSILGKTKFTEQKAEEFLSNSSTSPATINTCFSILGKSEFTEQKAKELLDNPNTSKETINNCFSILGKTEFTEQKAKEFLDNPNTSKETINNCFSILGKTEFTEQKAKEFLDNPNTDFQTINKCLWILKEKAFTYADNFINNNPKVYGTNIFTYIHCIQIIQKEKKSIKLLENLFKQYDRNIYVKYQVLKKPFFKIEIWRHHVENIITNWDKYPRNLVYASLFGYQSQIKFTELPCLGVILNWEREIQDQIDKGFSEIFDLHIAFSLGHPSHRYQAKCISESIYKKQQVEPNFGRTYFKEVVENIATKGIYPEWNEEYK